MPLEYPPSVIIAVGFYSKTIEPCFHVVWRVNTRDEQCCDKYLGESLQGPRHGARRCKEKVRSRGRILVLRVGPLSSVGRHPAVPAVQILGMANLYFQSDQSIP